jgi:GTPase SAR1 family protein
MQNLREVRVVVVGRTSAGKSSLASVLCPSTEFPISTLAMSSTDKATIGHQDWPAYGLKLVVCDTMGLADTQHSDEVVRERVTDGVRALVGGVDFFLLVMKHGERFTQQDHLAFTYLFEAILGKNSLPNVYLVVSCAGDAATFPEVQQEWITQSRGNKLFAHMVDLIGAHKIIFVDIPPTTRVVDEESRNEIKRTRSRETVLSRLASARNPRFVISALEEAQQAFDKQMEDAAQMADAQLQRLIATQVEAATEQQKRGFQEFIDTWRQKNEEVRQERERMHQAEMGRMAAQWKEEAEQRANAEKQRLMIEKAKIEEASDEQVKQLNEAIESLSRQYEQMLTHQDEMTRISTQQVTKGENKLLDLLSKIAIVVGPFVAMVIGGIPFVL